MSTPKGDSDDEVSPDNLMQRQDPVADGSDLDVVRGDNTLSALTAEISEENKLLCDSTEQATKSDEKKGLAITAAEEVSTVTGWVDPINGGRSSTNDEKGSGNLHGDLEHSEKEAETTKIPISLQSREILERGHSSATNIHPVGHDTKVDPSASSDTFPQIQTPNSSPNMAVIVKAGSYSLPLIQTPNAVVPSSQSNQEKFSFPVRFEKSLDKLQPRRNPDACINIPHSPSVTLTPEKPSEDGFNWRKYGQKLVKGNEFVRSYYRCTYFNCLAKKQVERSNAGQITDINYIGEHEHPRLQHTPQVGIAVIQPPSTKKPELSVVSSPEGITTVIPLALRKPDLHIVSNPKAETSSAPDSVVSQLAESKMVTPPSTLAKVSLKGSTTDEVDNTSGPDLKRQKIDISSSNEPMMNKHSSESRQVVQTMSEVDLVNDGYRWRKYGQKLVKGNPNPRSYYRCSNSGCPVKKHIERASHDPKLVITTYEGQHDHEMPFTRTVTQNTSGGGVAALLGDSRSSETGENQTNGLEMVVHISAK